MCKIDNSETQATLGQDIEKRPTKQHRTILCTFCRQEDETSEHLFDVLSVDRKMKLQNIYFMTASVVMVIMLTLSVINCDVDPRSNQRFYYCYLLRLC
jgi:hypothetical protein